MKNEIDELTKQVKELTEEVRRLRESQPLGLPTYIPYPVPQPYPAGWIPVNPYPNPYGPIWIGNPITCGGSTLSSLSS